MSSTRTARDAAGKVIRRGDTVRVVGVPDLTGMSRAGVRQTRPVFLHILGTYRRILGFDARGLAEIVLRIRQGRHAGMHVVAIEPHLLRRKEQRT